MRHRRGLVRAAFLVLAVGLLIAALVSAGPDLRVALGQLTATQLTVSALLALVGLVAQMLSWRSLLVGTGPAPPMVACARIYFVGQLGKYVPGSVWAVVAQAELGRDHKVSRARSGVVALSALGVLVVVGGLVAIAGLAAGSPGSLRTYWWAIVVVLGGAAVLVPSVFNRLVATAIRRLRRETVAVTIDGRTLAASVGWALAMWMLFGAHAWVLASGLGAKQDVGSVALVVGAFALAWVVGLLVVVAPAGAGAREVALVLALAPVLGRADALALALVSRVLLIVADGVAAGAVTLQRSRRNATPNDDES